MLYLELLWEWVVIYRCEHTEVEVKWVIYQVNVALFRGIPLGGGGYI